MVWARLDDQMLDNPKIAKAGIYGFAMHVAGIIWCCRNLSDGHIPYSRVTSLLTLDRVLIDTSNPLALLDGPSSMGGDDGLDPYVVADHLVTCGMWIRTADGYEIHDFLDYNPSRAEVESKRAANARKQAKSREKRKNGVRSPSNVTGQSPVTLPASASLPDPDPHLEQDPCVSSDVSSSEITDPTCQLAVEAQQQLPPTGRLPDGVVAFERSFWVAAYERAVAEAGGGAGWSMPQKQIAALRAVIESRSTGEERRDIGAWIDREVREFVRSVLCLRVPVGIYSAFGPDGLQRWYNEGRPGRDGQPSATRMRASVPLQSRGDRPQLWKAGK